MLLRPCCMLWEFVIVFYSTGKRKSVRFDKQTLLVGVEGFEPSE